MSSIASSRIRAFVDAPEPSSISGASRLNLDHGHAFRFFEFETISDSLSHLRDCDSKLSTADLAMLDKSLHYGAGHV